MQQSVAVEFTRPANTTPYAAGDVITSDPAAVLEWEGLPWQKNGQGHIFSAVIQKSTANITNAKFRLWLYGATIATVGADNAPATFRFADRDKFIGLVDFPLSVQDGSSVYAVIPIDNELSVPFKCSGGSKSIFGVLVAEGAYTPGSEEVFNIRLSCERE